MDPKHLMQLAVILDKGSITAAAESLLLTQPTLTRNMNTLEMQAGGPLFSRSRFGVKPTLLGDSLAREGRAVKRTLQSATDSVARHKMGLSNLLRIGVGPLIGMGITARLAERMMTLHPHLTITVGTAPPQRALELLIDGEVDVIIAPAVYAQSPVGIARVLLAEDEIGVYCGPRHPLAGRTDLTSSDLAQCDWINVGTTSPFQAEQTELLAKNGVQQVRTRFATHNDGVILLDFLSLNRHMAVLPGVPLMLLRDRYPFYEVPLPHGKSRRDLFVWCRQDIRSSAVIESFILQGQALIAQHRQGAAGTGPDTATDNRE
ncbi:MAG: LysR family transcriptional regulator [Burkholderiaceae bacterium]